jgi:hypothetical protein
MPGYDSPCGLVGSIATLWTSSRSEHSARLGCPVKIIQAAERIEACQARMSLGVCRSKYLPGIRATTLGQEQHDVGAGFPDLGSLDLRRVNASRPSAWRAWRLL